MSRIPVTGPGFRNYLRVQVNGVDIGVPCSVDRINFTGGGIYAYREGEVVFVEMLRFITSRPYPLTPEDEMRVSADFLGGGFLYWPTDHMTVGGDFMAGTIRIGLVSYEDWPSEEVSVAGDFLEGTLIAGGDTVLYEDWPPEEMDVAGDFVGGTIEVGLLTYENPPESISVGGDWLDGSLT